MDRKFIRSDKKRYSNEEKLALAKLVKSCKEEYDAEVQRNQGKTKYDSKRKRHVPIKPTTGYVAKAVRMFYSDLADVRNDDPAFERAIKLAARSYQDIDILQDPSSCPPKKARALFAWFVDVRETLKGRLPRRLFKLKANQLYKQWLEQNPATENERLKFSNCWIKGWEKEYGISLRKPNKRFSIKKTDLIERLQDYLKNVWTLRRFFIQKYGVDPPIINGDQMPLHRNESSQQKTLAFKGEDTFVKENYMLSRERVTVFTQVTNKESIKLDPEFVFKGKGTRTKVSVPDSVKYQWSPSGSYRIDQMLETISHLPNRYNPFTQKDFAIYVLDDYAVHLIPEVRKALYLRGYILVLMGGGITGFIQANDTDLHHHLKRRYRHEEMALMLKKLEVDKNKVPAPSREEMINLLLAAWRETVVDFAAVFKKLFVSNNLDGSEDFLVSDKLFSLIGDDMLEFRRQLLSSKLPINLQAVIKTLIPPKGIRRNNIEGMELLDYMEGDAIFEDPASEAESENSEQFSSDDEVDSETEMEAENTIEQVIPTATQVPAVPAVPTIKSLQNICSDPDVNKDAKFLDDLQKLFQDSETSLMFKPHLSKIKAGFFEGRRSLKKRILTKTRQESDHTNSNEDNDSLLEIASEDDGNIFDMLEDM